MSYFFSLSISNSLISRSIRKGGLLKTKYQVNCRIRFSAQDHLASNVCVSSTMPWGLWPGCSLFCMNRGRHGPLRVQNSSGSFCYPNPSYHNQAKGRGERGSCSDCCSLSNSGYIFSHINRVNFINGSGNTPPGVLEWSCKTVRR